MSGVSTAAPRAHLTPTMTPFLKPAENSSLAEVATLNCLKTHLSLVYFNASASTSKSTLVSVPSQ